MNVDKETHINKGSCSLASSLSSTEYTSLRSDAEMIGTEGRSFMAKYDDHKNTVYVESNHGVDSGDGCGVNRGCTWSYIYDEVV